MMVCIYQAMLIPILLVIQATTTGIHLQYSLGQAFSKNGPANFITGLLIASAKERASEIVRANLIARAAATPSQTLYIVERASSTCVVHNGSNGKIC